MTKEDEAFAFKNFDSIFRQIIQDLGVSRMVLGFRIEADPDEPYFLISLRLGKARGAIKVRDMAEVNESSRGTMMTITDESFAPALLTKLWSKYGRDRVDQMTRFELLVKGVAPEEVSELELDPGEEMRAKLLDAVWRLFPEGFKVRHNIMDDEVMTIIGTEHDMDPKWIEIAQKVHKEMHEMKEAAPDV